MAEEVKQEVTEQAPAAPAAEQANASAEQAPAAEQAEEVGYSDTVINALSNVSLPRRGVFTSESALSVYESIQHYVKGLVFTG